jgi:acyl-CoA reductase-like NAD-dependent aldehyde dehydrogenase
MSELVITIGGEGVGTEASFGVRNPATGEVFAQVPERAPQQLDTAFEAVKSARLNAATAPMLS